MGAERTIVQKHCFRERRHDSKVLKVQLLSSRDFVVVAQAPILVVFRNLGHGTSGIQPKATAASHSAVGLTEDA